MADKEKTFVEDVDRSLYDFRNVDEDVYKVAEGLTPEIVEQISKEKNDPEWMKEHRLASLEIYNNLEMKEWGPPIDGLNMDNIVTYIKPKDNKMSADWDEVPEGKYTLTYDLNGRASTLPIGATISASLMIIPMVCFLVSPIQRRIP